MSRRHDGPATRTRKILLVGGSGQLGTALRAQSWPATTELIAPDRKRLDIADGESVVRFFSALKVDLIINAAAYTAVDAAEDDAASAYAANLTGPTHLAAAARVHDTPLIHLSTDYVFDGSKGDRYEEDDPVSPLGVYGASKAAGEAALRALHPRSVIIRTAWLGSPYGRNFLKSMLALAAEQSIVRVVADQRGNPTIAGDLAAAIVQIALRQLDDPDTLGGTYHLTNAGEATWYEFAAAIFENAAKYRERVPAIEAASSDGYLTRAARPADSRLNCSKLQADYGIAMRPWRHALAETVAALLGRPLA